MGEDLQKNVNGVFDAVKTYVGEGYVDLSRITINDTSRKGSICEIDKTIKRSVIRETLLNSSQAFYTRFPGGVQSGRPIPVTAIVNRIVSMINKINEYYTDVYKISWDLDNDLFQIFRESGVVISGTVSNYSEVKGIELSRRFTV